MQIPTYLVWVGIFAAGYLSCWLTPHDAPPAPVGEVVVAKVAPQLRDVPTREIHPPKVKVYAKVAKDKLSLPDAMKADKDLQVLLSSRIPRDEHNQTVTSLIDEKTGDVTTVVRREPLPWFALERRGEIRLDYGVRYPRGRHPVEVTRLTINEQLFQVKAVHFGVSASLDSQGQLGMGAEAVYRW